MSKYLNLYQQVFHYVEKNLDETLDVEKLCNIFCLSKYHFHRQCSAYFGMPVISVIRRLKLKRAAYQLAYRDKDKIIDIALASGYESHEAFSRSFKRHFNKSPSEFRKSSDWTPWHSIYEPVVKLRTKIVNNSVEFKVKTVDFPETMLAVLEHRAAPAFLGKTLQNFISWRKENGLAPNKSRTFNLVYDDPNTVTPEEYKFDLCCSVNRAIATNAYGVINKNIPRGTCAVIRHIGSDDTLGVAVSFLYCQWLQTSGYQLRNFPLFFERVSFFPDVSESDMITDIYLPIE